MKRKYYEQKRREQMQRAVQNRIEGKGVPQQQAGPQQRFTGGGFNLAIWSDSSVMSWVQLDTHNESHLTVLSLTRQHVADALPETSY